MYIDCESVYSSSSAVKQTSETNEKKLIRYLCFISVDFIHSCHRCLKLCSFSLEKNWFRSIDQTSWRSTNHCLYEFKLPWVRVLESFFGPRATAVILKIPHPLKYPGLTLMSSKSKKKSFTTVCHVYLLRWQRWWAHSQHGAVNVTSYKESLNQSDC